MVQVDSLVVGEADGLISGSTNIDLCKNCRHCNIALTTENAAKKNAEYYRNECKKCRSRSVVKSMVGNPKRQKYAREYVRRNGIVKEYPCETCSVSCYKHYTRAFCSDKCRFLAYINKTETCWLWTGTKARRGYGRLCFGDNKSAIASRVSYELFKGPIEDKMFICHTCDVPSCVNPDHLWAGTHMENTIDMIDKGRQSSKLYPQDILNIRKLWNKGHSNAKLCEMFNITSGTVSSIIHRRIWKHI